MFRDMWENNKVETDGEEGFRDLCLRTLKENDPQKQRLLLEKMSRRLKDDMFSTEKGSSVNEDKARAVLTIWPPPSP